MNSYQRGLRAISKTEWFRWVTSRILTPLDLRLRNTRFAPSKIGSAVPLCYLTTTGASSGEPRTAPLLYLREGASVLVAATNFGKERHPGWSFNLDKTPTAELEIDGQTTSVVAHRVPADAMENYWPRFADMWPAYDKYRAITDRDVKMYELVAEAVSP